MGLTPHTRAELNRVGFGWHAPTTCGHECSSVQEIPGPAIFWKLFLSFGASGQSKSSLDSELFPNTWRLGMTPEHLDSERALSTRNHSRVLTRGYLGVDPEQLDSRALGPRNIPELCLTLPKCFMFLTCNVFWLGKSVSANEQSCCTLIATNMNVRLNCAGAISNRQSSVPINKVSLFILGHRDAPKI